MILRYTGSGVVTFADPQVGEVAPGQEFIVSDEEAAAYLTRDDIELAGDAEETTPPTSTFVLEPFPAAEEPEAPEATETAD